MTQLEIIKLIARAEFRPMTGSDYCGYAGAGEDTVIAQVDDFDILYGDPDGGRPFYEIHHIAEDGDGAAWRVDVEQVI